MSDVKFVLGKIELIQRDLGRLEEFGNKTFTEIAPDWRAFSIVKNLLLEIIGRAIDTNQHLIVKLSKKPQRLPLTYSETFLKLAELKILPLSFAQEIAKSAGFRNAIFVATTELIKG